MKIKSVITKGVILIPETDGHQMSDYKTLYEDEKQMHAEWKKLAQELGARKCIKCKFLGRAEGKADYCVALEMYFLTYRPEAFGCDAFKSARSDETATPKSE
jgi:hypothetical protein